MPRGLARFFTTPVVVEPYLSTDGRGRDLFGPPVTVTVYAEDKRQLVRASDGEQVQSATALYGPVDAAACFTPNARVTLPSGTTARVITTNANAIGSAADHVAVTLT